MDSYKEEKQGLIDHKVYENISKSHYLYLIRAENTPKAIPSMCVLVVENDTDRKTLCAKSRIVVLGNFEDRLYQKSQRYSPVLKYSSLNLLTSKSLGDKWILQQGDWKDELCNSTLPGDEVTVIIPPIGDLAFQEYEYWLLKKTLYGLCQYPHHWYNIMKGILLKMGLKASPHDPWLIYIILDDPSYPQTTS